jgi:hypothetical protein
MSDLSTKPCPECGGLSIEWVHNLIRWGWHCVCCGHFDKSVGRERIVNLNEGSGK